MFARLLIFVCIFFVSCDGQKKNAPKKYIDLKGFFKNEATRLKKLKIKVDKTVSRNGVSESKKNISPDWDIELSLFTESDINKAAWNNSYRMHKEGGHTSYTALDSSLRTQLILIKQNEQGKLVDVKILNKTKNSLYSSFEELRYIPDSLYRIIKKQDVILIGKNSYNISGFF